MYTITLSGGITRQLPSSWHELTPGQIRFIVRTHHHCVAHRLSPLHFNIRVLFYLLGVRHDWRSLLWERLNPDRVADRNANIYMLCQQCLSWLFVDDDHAQLSFTALTNALPTVRPRPLSRKWRGPADALPTSPLATSVAQPTPWPHSSAPKMSTTFTSASSTSTARPRGASPARADTLAPSTPPPSSATSAPSPASHSGRRASFFFGSPPASASYSRPPTCASMATPST